jgi:anti-anti-sigma factor
MDIKITNKEIKDGNVLSVQGEIDVYTSPKVKEAIGNLIEQSKYNIVVNLEEVRYIDSTGLGVLIGALKRLREHNGNISLVCSNPQIKKIFQITGLVKIFGIFKSEEEAQANLGLV